MWLPTRPLSLSGILFPTPLGAVGSGGGAPGGSNTHIPVYPTCCEPCFPIAEVPSPKGRHPPELPLTFSLLSQIQIPSSKEEGALFFVPILVQRDMCQLINTHSTLHSGLFAIYINRKLVTSRQGQAQGQDHNRGSEDTTDLFVRRCIDSGMQEGHTLPSSNAGAHSPSAPAHRGPGLAAGGLSRSPRTAEDEPSACFSALSPPQCFCLPLISCTNQTFSEKIQMNIKRKPLLVTLPD